MANPLIQKLINAQNTVVKNSTTIGSEMSATVKIWIPTGSVEFDTIISNDYIGGWPCGRFVELYGPEGIGKSSLTFKGLANCQKMGGIAIYYDAEQAGAETLMQACGIDMSQLIYSSANTVEDIFESLQTNLEIIANDKSMAGLPVLCVIDSLAAISTNVEAEGDYDFNMNVSLAKAKQLGKALMKITPYLTKANCCLIAINQLREKPGISFGDTSYAPGGKAKAFYASLRIKLLGQEKIEILDPSIQKQLDEELDLWKSTPKASRGAKPKASAKKEDKLYVGCHVNARTDKNKVGPPKRSANFTIMFFEGIKEYESFFNTLLKSGYILQQGTTYVLPYGDYAGETFYKVNWHEVMDRPGHYDVLKKEVQKYLIKDLLPKTPGAVLVSALDDDDDEDEYLTPSMKMPESDEDDI